MIVNKAVIFSPTQAVHTDYDSRVVCRIFWDGWQVQRHIQHHCERCYGGSIRIERYEVVERCCFCMTLCSSDANRELAVKTRDTRSWKCRVIQTRLCKMMQRQGATHATAIIPDASTLRTLQVMNFIGPGEWSVRVATTAPSMHTTRFVALPEPGR